MSTTGGFCPVGETPTRRALDVIDEIARSAVEEGGSIEHVVAETPLTPHKVGAILRFPVPAALV